MKQYNESDIIFEYDEDVCQCIKFDEPNAKEKKAKMSAWGDKLKKKLHWLHATAISINNVDNPPPISLKGT
ncbi:hypothetical protein AGMMS4957_02540 [Bacteroidia bacterium]|nr:hypothetical protein AGMMS4957_02540 [Bacteroidia bacterium]